MKKPEQTDQETEYVTFCGGIRPLPVLLPRNEETGNTARN